MKHLILTSILGLLLCLCACSPDPVSTDFKLTGFAQKGPFTIGSRIIVSELSQNVIETGRNFNGTIQDDRGSFTVEGSGLTSTIVGITADGFYFNEITGQVSASRLVLSGLVNLSANNTLNVNVLTHLEFERLKHLMKSGQTFAKAKEQAEKEILAIFKITETTPQFEQLDFSKEGNGNAILLAISAIVQGTNTVGELSELLAKISLDIKEDGVLNAENLKSALINEATLLNTATIRANIEKRYKDLGVTATIGNFEKYIDQFVKTSGYTVTKKIIYPTKDATTGLLNVLTFPADTTVEISNDKYCLAATMNAGQSLKLIISTNAPVGVFPFGYHLGSNKGLDISVYNGGKQTYQSTNTTPYVTFAIGEADIKIEIYENGAATPIRTINIKGMRYPYLAIDANGKYGKNILAQPYSSTYAKGDHSFQLRTTDNGSRTIKYEFYLSGTEDIKFTLPQAWVITEENQPPYKKVILTCQGVKVNADAKVTLNGIGSTTMQCFIDGVLKDDLYKKMNW
jgi:hypothetical protein